MECSEFCCRYDRPACVRWHVDCVSAEQSEHDGGDLGHLSRFTTRAHDHWHPLYRIGLCKGCWKHVVPYADLGFLQWQWGRCLVQSGDWNGGNNLIRQHSFSRVLDHHACRQWLVSLHTNGHSVSRNKLHQLRAYFAVGQYKWRQLPEQSNHRQWNLRLAATD